MYDNEYLDAPGCLNDIVAHPNGLGKKSIEIALMLSHRFAFYYWNKWTRKLCKENRSVPDLVSIDWHKDLCHPVDIEMEVLRNLNLNDNVAVGKYAWAELNSLNDSHVLSAAYLNLINDIYVLCKQEESDSDRIFEDYNGKNHNIFCFRNTDDLISKLVEKETTQNYFDIDLDFFIESDDFCGDEGEFIKVDDIKSFFDCNVDLWKYIFKEMQGFTIATEPKWCNGIFNSNKAMDILNEYFFENTLFKKDTIWNHLKKYGYYE